MQYKLYNGDCREVMKTEEYKKTTSGKNIIIVTDPPFNVPSEEYLQMIKSTTGDNPFVLIHYPERLYKIAAYIGEAPERVCSWVYNSNTPRQHRDVAFFRIKPRFEQVKQPYKNPNDRRIKKRIAEGKGAKLYDWWEENQVKNISREKTGHPCQMPLKIMENIIGILPQENLLVVDPFMGSGTTGVACIREGVDFIGIEVDADYYNIAQERMQNEGDSND